MSDLPLHVGQPTPQQMAQMQAQIAAEAQRRGLTPQQFQAQQRQQIEADAKKAGMTFDQYVNHIRKQAYEQHQRQQQMAQQQANQPQQGQQVPINPGPPDPKAIAVAKWLRSQDLKTRTSILNGQRKDMFKVKRALRALQSPAYTVASSKPKSLLPPVTNDETAIQVFKLLPLSLLALRVSKTDPHEGHSHAPPKKPAKRTKGLWHVKIENQQEAEPDIHYIWLYEGPQWKQKIYAGLALGVIMTVVMFPLWPIKLRIGVWYLCMGVLGLLGLFFAMCIFRLILFCVTVFSNPPGLWLYPNLFEDVGFFDSFRPVWGWQEDKKKKKSSKATSKKTAASKQEMSSKKSALTTQSTMANGNGSIHKRDLTPRVEEVEED